MFIPRNRGTGIDLSPTLLAIACDRLGTDVPLNLADMADFNLSNSFNLVTCLIASTAYLLTVARLRSAIAAMASNLILEGILFIKPWLTPDAYRENAIVNYHRKTLDLMAS
jgi:predicted TPR repeat methyltransferase